MAQSDIMSSSDNPDTPDAINEVAGCALFAKPCRFITSAVSLDGLPHSDMSEVAFAGRSNVGKSSLINALTNRKSLARASKTPGRTRMINFFDLGDKITLVDLPGYGFARAPKKDIKVWKGLTSDYLQGRVNLRRVMVLIDSRRGLGSNDLKVIESLERVAVSWTAVLTKIDTLSATGRAAVITETEARVSRHVAAWPGVFVTSAEKNLGLDALRGHIATLAFL